MLQLLNPIAKPIAAVLAAFYSVVPNYGVDILVLSVVWMLIISPLTLKSTRSMLAMQALQPELKRLQEKHRNDRQAFAQAQMDLFRERGVSPFGSCLPMLLPMPVFFALFEVIDGLSNMTKNAAGVLVPSPRYVSHTTAMYKAIVDAHGHINAFGLDLSKNALSPHASFLAALPFYILLLVMIATQYYQTAMTMSRNPAAQQNSQMKMMKFLPLVFGLFCIRFPAGVVLYYAMSNVCRIGQQWAMYRFDPQVKALVTQEVDEVEAKTREIDRTQGPGGQRGAKAAPASPPPARSRLRDILASAGAVSEENRQQRALPPSRQQGGTKTPKQRGAPGAGSGGGTGAAKAAGAGGTGAARGARTGQPRPAGSSGAGSGGAGSGAAAKSQPKAAKPTPNGQPGKDQGNGKSSAPAKSGQRPGGNGTKAPGPEPAGAGVRSAASGPTGGTGGAASARPRRPKRRRRR